MPKKTKKNERGAGRKKLPFETVFCGGNINVEHRRMFYELRNKTGLNSRQLLEQMIEEKHQRLFGE